MAAAVSSLREAESGSVVYFLRDQAGLVKIGRTSDLKGRLKVLQHKHGALEVLATRTGGAMMEAAIHQKFAGDQLGHEWFLPSDELIRFITECPPVAASPSPGAFASELIERWFGTHVDEVTPRPKVSR